MILKFSIQPILGRINGRSQGNHKKELEKLALAGKHADWLAWLISLWSLNLFIPSISFHLCVSDNVTSESFY